VAAEDEVEDKTTEEEELPVISKERLKAASQLCAVATRKQLKNRKETDDISEMLRSEIIVMQPDKNDVVTVSLYFIRAYVYIIIYIIYKLYTIFYLCN